MKKYLLPLILILFLTFVLIGNCDWLSGYDQRIKLTIDNTKIDSALSDFPVTVFFTPTQAEEIFTEFDADSDYMKCAFTSSDGTTQLYAEKELFDIFKSQYPPAQSATYVKATSTYSASYYPYFATDPTKTLTGNYKDNAWICGNGTTTNQRFHIDLGSAKAIKYIYYENLHTSGSDTNKGVQNFTFWGSNTGAGTFDDLVYANDEGWTQLTISQSTFDQHTANDVVDPKYITVTNSTAYRYYAFKFADNYGYASYMGVRRIELQIAKAIYHVKVTSVASGADTDIYYYYDNDHADNTTYIGAINTVAGGNVWDSNFEAVYHMIDATTSTVLDSTDNNNDGTKKGAGEPASTNSKVGLAQDFDATDDYITVPAISLDNMMIEAIVKPDDLSTHRTIITNNVGSTPLLLMRFTDVTNAYIQATDDEGDTYYSTFEHGCPAGNYYHYVTTVDGTTIKAYINTIEKATGTNASYGSCTFSTNFYIGVDNRLGDRTRPFDGIIDEFRISSSARSVSWIKATYNSLWDTLLTYGSEETEEAEEANAIFFGMNF